MMHRQNQRKQWLWVALLLLGFTTTGFGPFAFEDTIASDSRDVPTPIPQVFNIAGRVINASGGEVPEEMYTVPIGKGVVRREGKDVTVVATSYMVFEALKAAEILEKEGVEAEVIDLRTLKPLDESLVFSSVKKTGKMVVADSGWKSFGAGAEITARVVESDAFRCLRAPVARVSLPDMPAPASRTLEEAYYPDAMAIAEAVRNVMGNE